MMENRGIGFQPMNLSKCCPLAGSQCHKSALPAEPPIHLILYVLAIAASFLSSCVAPDRAHRIVISARDQKLALLEKGKLLAVYPVSTSKFGLGDGRGTWRTPVGEMEIAQKVGDGAPLGTVFKDRRRTGEIVAVNALGRDPIVTRILWLKGREPQNANAYARDIYIHGTPEERNIGRPVSYGCIRMRSVDVIQLYDLVGRGAEVSIVDSPLAAVVPGLNVDHMAKANPDGGLMLPVEP
jgi:lipoprotein-anchoring transpeptidase ErfK/SrfK